jgi:hypothetical protein
MRDDHRKIFQRLFVKATGIASFGQEIAVLGQSPKHNPKRYAVIAKRLHQRSVDLATVAANISMALKAAARTNRKSK